MQPFLHDRGQRFEQLIESSTSALRSYTSRDLGCSDVVLAFLDGAAAEYRAMGLSSGENELVSLLAQFTSAHEGVDPMTSERVTVRRREMERGIALRVLLLAGERLRTDVDGVQAALDHAREQLAPLVLHAFASGFVVPGPDGTLTQPELEKMWLRLLNDPEAAPAARLVALQVAAPDVLLLLADLLASLNGA